jgi:hypothetical protein
MLLFVTRDCWYTPAETAFGNSYCHTRLTGVVQGINCLATHTLRVAVAGDLLLTCPHLLGAA